MIKNKYERTLEHTKEMYGFILFKSPRGTIKIMIWCLLFMLSLAWIPLMCLIFGHCHMYDIFVSILLAVAAFVYVICDVYNYKKQ